jgi:hypothetical protein
VSLPNGGALPTSAAANAVLTCELRSVFSGAEVSDPRLLPRYGSISALSLPLVALPAQQPLLAGIVMESRAVVGTFRVLAGVGAGTVLPPLFAPSAPANATNAPQGNSSSNPPNSTSHNSTTDNAPPQTWDSPLLSTPAGAALILPPLLSLLAPLQAAPALAAQAPSQLSITLSFSTHLLLLFPASSPVDSALNVTLNSFPCRVNWVGGGGTVVSVTTPPLTTFCAGAISDCGSAVMVLRRGGEDPLSALLSSLRAFREPAAAEGAPPTLHLPAAYPPLAVPALSPAPALAGLSATDLLAHARSAAPPSAGIRLAEACTDPAYAPAEACALVNGAPPPPPPAGTVCAYGAGASCIPCPTDRALCPGGYALLLKPGWWAPLPTSPLSDVVRCPAPSVERCPGSLASAAAGGGAGSLCAPGYTGAACGACARGYFASQGSCAACPTLDAYSAYILPAQFLLGLLALGAVLLVLARRALSKLRGGRAPPLFGESGSATAVAALLLWAWGAAQTLSALFSQTVADGSVPRSLVAVFAAFSALQFQGVTVAPACTSSGDPFSPLWSSAAAALGAAALAALCVLVLLAGARAAATAAAPPLALRAAHSLLSLCVAFFGVGYGALVGNAVNALACNAPASLSLADYVGLGGDGTAVTAALGARAPNMTVLRAAADDAVYAQQAGLTRLLSTPLSVSLLAADPNVVCGERAHARARPIAVALLCFLAGGLPLFLLAALLCAGRLKGLRRRARWSAGKKSGAPDRHPTVAGLFVGALRKKELLPRAQWLVAHGWLLTALCTGATSYVGTAPSFGAYLAYQLSMASALLASALLLWRVQPNVERARWQNTVQVALFTLAGITAGANAALRYWTVLAPGTIAALGLCATLLALAAFVLALLLVQWWCSLVAQGAAAQKALAERAEGVNAARTVLGRGAGGMVVRRAWEEEEEKEEEEEEEEEAVHVHTRNPLHDGLVTEGEVGEQSGGGGDAGAAEGAEKAPPVPPHASLPLLEGVLLAALALSEGAAVPFPQRMRPVLPQLQLVKEAASPLQDARALKRPEGALTAQKASALMIREAPARMMEEPSAPASGSAAKTKWGP